MATYTDGRFSTDLLNSPGYVRECATGLTVYVQYGTYWDEQTKTNEEADPALLAEMRAFILRAMDDREAQRKQRELAALTASAETSAACPHYTRDEGCPLHGETCAPEYR